MFPTVGTRILIVDPSLFVSLSVARICRDEIAGAEVVTARTLPWAAVRCCQPPPDIVIFDPKFLTSEDWAIFGPFLRVVRGAKLLVFGDRCDSLTLLRASRVGVAGYVLKTVAATPILGWAVRQILRGERAFQCEVERKMSEFLVGPSSCFRLLSDREQELLPDMGSGASNEELSDRYGRSSKTINNQRHSIMQKLGAHSATELMRAALHLGFVYVDYRGALRQASKWDLVLDAQLELF